MTRIFGIFSSSKAREFRFVISKMGENGKWNRCLDTPFRGCKTDKLTITSSQLCSGDQNRSLKLDVYKILSNGD